MKVFGRRLLDRSEQIAIDFDDIVFEVDDGIEIRVFIAPEKITASKYGSMKAP